MSHLRLIALAAVAGLLALAPPAAAELGLSDPHTTITGLGDSGWSPYVQPVGDVNGDGAEDLLVQPEEGVSPCPSPAYVVLGSPTGAVLDLQHLGDRGITITGLDTCASFWGAVALGDVNGDGRDDIGLSTRSPRVMFGRPGGTTVDASDLGTGGLTFAGDHVRIDRIAHVGDVNGDGRADVGLSGVYGEGDGRLGVTGVVFGRPLGGAVDVGSTSTPGLLIGDPATASGATIRGVGDVNRDGKADVLATFSEEHALVLGRAAPGVVDVSQPGAAIRVGDDRLSADFGIRALEDVDGDRGAELTSELAYTPIRLFPSSNTAPYYDLRESAPHTDISASLGFVGPATWVGDVGGDGARDMLVRALYPIRTGPWMTADVGATPFTYLVTDLRPRSIDLRLTKSGVRRLALEDGLSPVLVALRFRGRIGRQAVVDRGDVITIQEFVEKPDPPADTTPPVLDDVGFDRAEISRDCTTRFGVDCPEPATSALRFTASEPTYVDMTLRRGSTVVTTMRGTVFGGELVGHPLPPVEWTLSAIKTGGWGGDIVDRLPAGTYTATLKPTDLAGITGETKTATIEVR